MAAKNPARYYPLHYYILLPLTLLMVSYTIRRLTDGKWASE